MKPECMKGCSSLFLELVKIFFLRNDGAFGFFPIDAILTSDDRVFWEVVSDCLVADMTSAFHETPSRVNQIQNEQVRDVLLLSLISERRSFGESPSLSTAVSKDVLQYPLAPT